MSLAHYLCHHCEGWGCRRCGDPLALPPTPGDVGPDYANGGPCRAPLDAKGLCRVHGRGCELKRSHAAMATVDAPPAPVELRVDDLRRQVVTLQVALVEAQCAAAVAQREVERLRALLGPRVTP